MTPALLAALALPAAPAIAIQADPSLSVAVSLPASPADQAVNRLATQAGVDVVFAVDLSASRTRALHGRYRVADAFARLLAPVGARAVPLGRGVYRIEAGPVSIPRASVTPPRPAPVPRAIPVVTQVDDVVVTAPVRRGGLDGVEGRNQIDPEALDRRQGAGSSEAIADLSATVDSTRQGSGRNKLFVRGLADSAFSGPLQATVGQYLGDLRLTYGSPDPDLALVDIRRIEVFEGPQGSRFGAASIGGVVRITPAAPETGAAFGSLSVGGSATRDGAPGADAALVINRPLDDRIAVRLAAWGRRDGGFIDNPVRGETDVDAVEAYGLRTQLRRTGEAWTLDGLVLLQRTRAGDAQLSTDADHLQSDRKLAQPYQSALDLAGLTASRRLGGLRLTSATSISRQNLNERFDATVAGGSGDAVVDRRQATTAVSTEARIETDPRDRWAWNGGFSLATGSTEVSRRRKALDETTPDWGVELKRRFTDVALFGSAILAPSDTLSVTVGGRLSLVRVVNRLDPIGPASAVRILKPEGFDTAFTPSVALRWSTPFGVSAFARFEEGERPGGVSETDGTIQRFRPDRVSLTELGFRTVAGGPLSAELSIGRLDWRDIQADTVTIGGDLVTANIGDGEVRFVQAKAAWRPRARWSVSGGLFANDSHVDLAGFGTIGVDAGAIPNVAPFGAQLSAEAGPFQVSSLALTLGADLRYVGRSQVGLGPGLDTPQGGYMRADLQARLGDDRRAIVLRVTNPFDVRATRFGIGSPYQLFDPQVAPLRPLTVRLGFEAAF